MRLRCLCLLVSLTAVLVAADKPNLTGTWKLNIEQSKLSDGNPIPYYTDFVQEIEHQEPRLKLIHKMKAPGRPEGRTVVLEMNTDEKEVDVKAGGPTRKVSAAWEGSRLVVRTIGDSYTVVRKYSLGPDGKSMTAEWDLAQQGGDVKATEVWEKQ